MSGFDALRDLLRENGLASTRIQSRTFQLCAGPCAIESEEQLEVCAVAAKNAKASFLRGGAFKLRSHHKSFAGLGDAAFRMLANAATRHGLLSVAEVTSSDHVLVAASYLSMLQIGARSMWNHALLHSAAQCAKPILLKRGIGASTSDWLLAAGRLLKWGAPEVTLCERGSRSPDSAPRNAVDLSSLIFLRDECSLDLWLDVSHSAGDASLAVALLHTARVLEINGAMIEIHPDPPHARCDSEQAVSCARLISFSGRITPLD